MDLKKYHITNKACNILQFYKTNYFILSLLNEHGSETDNYKLRVDIRQMFT